MNMQKVKMRFLEEMDDIARCCLNDESLIDVWLMGGIPDGADSYDYEDFASDDELFAETCTLFAKLVTEAVNKKDFLK